MTRPQTSTFPREEGHEREDELATYIGLERRILFVRGQRVMLDENRASLYGVSTKRLNGKLGSDPILFI